MPPVVRPEQVTKALEKDGFSFIKQRGSHKKYRKDNRTVIVPMHYELATGTVKSILEQSGLTMEQIIGKQN
jgi:predicted RNA binding protein YcfA (HicA-like mRNA interferase family)